MILEKWHMAISKCIYRYAKHFGQLHGAIMIFDEISGHLSNWSFHISSEQAIKCEVKMVDTQNFDRICIV